MMLEHEGANRAKANDLLQLSISTLTSLEIDQLDQLIDFDPARDTEV